jgi:hypothetical protein
MSLTKTELYEVLHDWIYRRPLVEAIISALKESKVPLDERRAKRLWFQALEELPALLSMLIHREKVYERDCAEGRKSNLSDPKNGVPA